jgi:uncharacterized membrane protein
MFGQLSTAGAAITETGRLVAPAETSALPAVRRITVADIKEALAKGIDDFAACRTDVVMLCLIYPLVGLLLAQWVFGNNLLPLMFPIASGFALVGPAAAVGMYEMSRRRELGASTGGWDAFRVVASPRFGAVVLLTAILLVIFAAWLVTAQAIYAVTLGPEPPASLGSFVGDIFGTSGGWLMVGVGLGVGFLFAVLVLAISVVSFPMLLDRAVGLPTALATSVRATLANPGPIAVWGLVVAAGLLVGCIPLFLGLAVVVPIFGHATWHLYRALIPDVRHAT